MKLDQAGIWTAGLVVAGGAAAATAHGLYEVAIAVRVPQSIAWLYPVITDGLALVAYAATARLQVSAARYAWAVVVLAAGLSGLAQAVFLAAVGPFTAGGPVAFGMGAWPAAAAAVTAHLLHLLGSRSARRETVGDLVARAGLVPAAAAAEQLGMAPAATDREPACPDGPGPQVTGPDLRSDPVVTDEDIAAWLLTEHTKTGAVPGRKATMAEWSIGSNRADRLRGAAAEETSPARGLRRIK